MRCAIVTGSLATAHLSIVRKVKGIKCVRFMWRRELMRRCEVRHHNVNFYRAFIHTKNRERSGSKVASGASDAVAFPALLPAVIAALSLGGCKCSSGPRSRSPSVSSPSRRRRRPLIIPSVKYCFTPGEDCTSFIVQRFFKARSEHFTLIPMARDRPPPPRSSRLQGDLDIAGSSLLAEARDLRTFGRRAGSSNLVGRAMKARNASEPW